MFRKFLLTVSIFCGYFHLSCGGNSPTTPSTVSLVLRGNKFTISMNSFQPSVAYNSQRNEYFVVWTNDSDIYGQRIAESGDLLGSNKLVVRRPSSQFQPFIVYNNQEDQYFVAWQTQQPRNFNNTFGRLLSSVGDTMNIEHHLSDESRLIYIAYNADDNEYLLTLSGIKTQRINRFGQKFGNAMSLSSLAANGESIYNSNVKEYFLTWFEASNFKGQRLFNNGAVASSTINISTGKTSSGGSYATRLSYDSENDEYLVVFTSSDEHKVYGQIISSSGSLKKEAFEIFEYNSSFVFYKIAYSSKDKVHALIWEDEDEVFALLLSSVGDIIHSPIPIIISNTPRSGLTLAYSSQSNSFIVIWVERDLGEFNVTGQILDIQ